MMATIFEPSATGLSVYVVFNSDNNFGEVFLSLREQGVINIGVAKDYGGNEPAGRFNWDEVIPVEVTYNPQIMLENIELEKAQSTFSQHELEEVFSFIKQNQQAILRHWTGEIDALELSEELK